MTFREECDHLAVASHAQQQQKPNT